MILLCVFTTNKINANEKKFDWTARADLDYTYRGKSEALKETLRFGARYKVYEPKHKKYMFYMGGNAITEHDLFTKVTKINGFFVLGFEY